MGNSETDTKPHRITPLAGPLPDDSWYEPSNGQKGERIEDTVREAITPKATIDLRVLATISEMAEHIHVAEVFDTTGQKRAAKTGIIADMAVRMGTRFQRPDAPYTAIFSPLMRDKIEAEIARIRTGKKMRRNPGGQWLGYGQWNLVDTATAQHPDHPWGASYCKKCQPYSLKRMHTIADRAQACIDGGISREPLPEEAFAWVRALDAKHAETMRRWTEKDQAGILPKGRAA